MAQSTEVVDASSRLATLKQRKTALKEELLALNKSIKKEQKRYARRKKSAMQCSPEDIGWYFSTFWPLARVLACCCYCFLHRLDRLHTTPPRVCKPCRIPACPL